MLQLSSATKNIFREKKYKAERMTMFAREKNTAVMETTNQREKIFSCNYPGNEIFQQSRYGIKNEGEM